MSERYRKKPIVIEAWRYNGALYEMPLWAATVAQDRISSEGLFINTPEGVMECGVGDWLIKGIKCEVYPCKHAIFMATYEPE